MYAGRNATRQTGPPRGGKGSNPDFRPGGGSARGGPSGAPAARGNEGFTIIKPKLDPKLEAELREEAREKRLQEEAMRDMQHVGAVSMESGNQDLVFDLVQEALAESRQADEGEDGLVVGDQEQYERLERRLVRLGFKPSQIGEAATAVGILDAVTVLDHLVLHTPENELPAQLREKKQQHKAQAGPMSEGQVMVPKHQKAFLAPPVVVLPGMAFRGPSQPAATTLEQTLVIPSQLKPKEERQVMELMSLGFERGEVLQALKLSNGSTQAASLMLMQTLGGEEASAPGELQLPADMSEDDLEEARFDERTALESIYGEAAFSEVWFDIGVVVGCEISFADGSVLLVRYDAPSVYPFEAPDVLVKGQSVPAHVRLDASKQLQAEARRLFDADPGAPLIYSLAVKCCEIIAEIQDTACKRNKAQAHQARTSKVVAPPGLHENKNSLLGLALQEAKGIVTEAAAAKKVYGVRGDQKTPAVGKVLGKVSKEEDGEVVRGKKLTHAQKESMEAAAARLSAHPVSRYSSALAWSWYYSLAPCALQL